MTQVVIKCIVEGKGEVVALPALLHKLIGQFCPDCLLITPPPILKTRSSLPKTGGLEKWVEVAARNTHRKGGVLVLLDADDDLPCQLAPALLARAQSASQGCPVSVVIANREFESWFLASAASLAGKEGLSANLSAPPNFEEIGDAKGWFKRERAGAGGYRPTLHQAALTRRNSPSFNKLCRDVQRLCQEVTARFGAT